MAEKRTPESTKKRFPAYLRTLQQLKQRGQERVMSYQIAVNCNVSADTVRRDLMFVKHQGKTSSGYEINGLIDALSNELGTSSSDEKLVLIGVGNIGQGLLKYNYIPAHVGQIVCAYDIDPNKIGTNINYVPVYDINKLKETFPENCKIAILAIPGEAIENVIIKLVALKVKAIINFSDAIPRKRNNVIIHQVDLAKIVSEIIYNFKTESIDKK